MRDDFPQGVKETLARRVGFRCSQPDCRQSTTGPQVEPTGAINVGVAAHITAAAPGGPRYDPSLTPDQRRSIDNAIWLCQTCAKLIDSDTSLYTVDVLRAWKQSAETRALASLERRPEARRGVRTRLVVEVISFVLGLLAVWWLTADRLRQTQLTWLLAVVVVAVWYVGLARRVRWRRETLGVAITLTAFWGLGAWYVGTAAERRAAEIFRIAERLQQRGFYVAAREKLRRECESGNTRTECPCTLGVYDAHLGDTRSARANFQACLAKAVETDDLMRQTAGLVDLGDLEELADQNALADRHFRDALELLARCPDSYGAYRAKLGLSRLAAKRGNYAEARAFALEALVIAEGKKQRGAAGQAHMLLGDYDSDQGAYSSSIAQYNAAALAYDAVGDRHRRTIVDSHVADLHRKQGRSDQARAEYKRALGEFQFWQDKRGQAEILLGLADVERLARRYGLAREYFDQALHLFQEMEDSLGQANTLIESAHLEKRTGNLQVARERYERARTLCQHAEDRNSEANAVRGLAALELKELWSDPKSKPVRIRRATDYLAQARQLYRSVGSALGEANVDLTEARLMWEIGRKEEGHLLWDRAGVVYARLGMGAAMRRMVEDLEHQVREQATRPPDGKTPPARQPVAHPGEK